MFFIFLKFELFLPEQTTMLSYYMLCYVMLCYVMVCHSQQMA